MKKLIKDNKMISAFAGFLILWGIWVTNSIFSQEKNKALNEGEKQTISQSVKEIKSDVAEFKKEVKADLQRVEDQINNNQKENKKDTQEMLKILIDIKKNSK